MGDLALRRLAEASDYSAPRVFGYAAYATDKGTAHVCASISRSAYDVRRTFAFTARLPDDFGSGPLFGGISRRATSRTSGLDADMWGEWVLPVRVGLWSLQPGTGIRYARYGHGGWDRAGS